MSALPAIERGIPMPTPRVRAPLNTNDLTNRILSCRQGDSFFVQTVDARRIQRNALVVARSLRLNYPTRARLRITTRSLVENGVEGVRIWRVK